MLNWVTWLAFAFELVVMLSVVPDWRRWLREHPLDVAIVLLTPPLLPAALQSLRVFRLLRLLRLLRLAQLSRRTFSLEGLKYAALLAVLTTVAAGAAFTAFEHDQHLTTWEGIYWSLTTMTTVGSNIYPTTTGGEVISVAVVLVGIAFVALLTGAVAQRFLGPEISETEAQLELGEASAEAEAIRQLEELQGQLRALQTTVGQIVTGRAEPG
jgi:voltage-gated potassium channel